MRKYTVTIRVEPVTKAILDRVIARHIEEGGGRITYDKAIVWLAEKVIPEVTKKAQARVERETQTPSPDKD